MYSCSDDDYVLLSFFQTFPLPEDLWSMKQPWRWVMHMTSCWVTFVTLFSDPVSSPKHGNLIQGPEPWPSSAPIFGSASLGTFSWRGRLGRERTMAKKFSSFNNTHHKICAKTSCMAAHEDQLMIKILFTLSHCSFLIGSVCGWGAWHWLYIHVP